MAKQGSKSNKNTTNKGTTSAANKIAAPAEPPAPLSEDSLEKTAAAATTGADVKGDDTAKTDSTTPAPLRRVSSRTTAAAASTTRKAYEVVGSINLGRKPGDSGPDIRTKGDTIYNDELPAEELRDLLRKGEILDTDAPVPPSRAEGFAALGDLMDIAIAAGLIERAGSDYNFAGRTYRGISEFRSNVTRDALKQALIDEVSA